MNISRTARDAEDESVAPAGAAPTTSASEFRVSEYCIPEFRVFQSRIWKFRPRDLLLPYPAAVGQAAKFFYRVENDFVGHIGGDFDFADFAGKNEVYGSVLSFLVGLQARENFAGAYFQFGQAAQAEDGIGDAAGGHAVSAADGKADVGGGNHSPGDGFAVKQALVAGFGLERVADGVAEVENAAQAAFLLVGGDDFGLQLYARGDHAFQFHGIALQDLRSAFVRSAGRDPDRR